jgi:RimJ/RimL family protein N-acetyltransferase
MQQIAHDGRADGAGGVLLRQAQEDDVQALSVLRGDAATQHLLMSHPEASGSGVMEWLDRRRNDPDGFFAIVADAADGRAIGFVQLNGIHRLDRHAFGGIALLPGARGRGAGRSAMCALMRVARDERGLRKLQLQVRSDNLPALSLYKSIGFRVVGVMCEHYDDGAQRHDVVLLEILLAADQA